MVSTKWHPSKRDEFYGLFINVFFPRNIFQEKLHPPFPKGGW